MTSPRPARTLSKANKCPPQTSSWPTITARQIEIREELERLQSRYSRDEPPERKEAELTEEFEQLTQRADQLRATLSPG